MRKALAALLVLSIMASASFAEWSEMLRVVVQDQNGYPVAGEKVTVKYQKNRFLATETVEETKSETTGGTAYMVPGNQTPSNLTLEELGVVEASVPVVDEYFEENVEPSEVKVTITRPDLSDADGLITGYTGPDGVFETLVRDFVPQANETKDYLVTVRGEERRVSYQQNVIGGRHVEFFRTKDSLIKLPILVVDFKDEPLAGALVDAPCWPGKNITTGAGGMVTIYPKTRSCKLTVTYGVFRTERSVAVKAEQIVLLRIIRDGDGFRVAALDSAEKPVKDETLAVKVAGQELEFSDDGVAQLPQGIAYGSLVNTFVSHQNYSISKWVYMQNGTVRFSMPTNEQVTIQIENYNNSLTVIVVDENGAPLENALVMLRDRSERTGPDGIVEFGEIYAASVNVSVFAVGLNKSKKAEFAGGSATVTFEFKRNPLEVTLKAINHTYEKGCKVLLTGRVYDPRVKKASDNAVSLSYFFEGGVEVSKKLLVGADGVTLQAAIPCPAELPATLVYRFEASNAFANYTSPQMRYVVPEQPPITSISDAFDETVDIVEQFTGSEATALLLVTVVLLVFIIVISIAALTALIHRRKLRKIVTGKEGEEGPRPPKLEI